MRVAKELSSLRICADSTEPSLFAVAISTEWSQVIVSNEIVLLSLNISFVLAKRVDPDEMLHQAAFHLGLQCLPKYVFRSH